MHFYRLCDRRKLLILVIDSFKPRWQCSSDANGPASLTTISSFSIQRSATLLLNLESGDGSKVLHHSFIFKFRVDETLQIKNVRTTKLQMSNHTYYLLFSALQ